MEPTQQPTNNSTPTEAAVEPTNTNATTATSAMAVDNTAIANPATTTQTPDSAMQPSIETPGAVVEPTGQTAEATTTPPTPMVEPTSTGQEQAGDQLNTQPPNAPSQ